MDKSTESTLKLIETLTKELTEIVGGDEIDAGNIINITVTVMKLLERNADLKGNGDQKKQLVILVLEKFISDKLGDSEDAKTIITLVKMFLPKTIDVLIALDKSEFVIKTKKCCNKYLCCCC